MRRIDDDQLRLWCQLFFNPIPRESKWGLQADIYRDATCQFYGGNITVLSRLKYNHLISRPHNRSDSWVNGFRSTGSDGHLFLWIMSCPGAGISLSGSF